MFDPDLSWGEEDGEGRGGGRRGGRSSPSPTIDY